VVRCYHTVHPTKAFASATPADFAWQLDWLQEHSPELTEAAHACRDVVEDFFSWHRVAKLHLQQYARLVA
jgi:hypothetical protein